MQHPQMQHSLMSEDRRQVLTMSSLRRCASEGLLSFAMAGILLIAPVPVSAQIPVNGPAWNRAYIYF